MQIHAKLLAEQVKAAVWHLSTSSMGSCCCSLDSYEETEAGCTLQSGLVCEVTVHKHVDTHEYTPVLTISSLAAPEASIEPVSCTSFCVLNLMGASLWVTAGRRFDEPSACLGAMPRCAHCTWRNARRVEAACMA